VNCWALRRIDGLRYHVLLIPLEFKLLWSALGSLQTRLHWIVAISSTEATIRLTVVWREFGRMAAHKVIGGLVQTAPIRARAASWVAQ